LEGACKCRIDPDRVVEIRNCVIVIALPVVRNGAVIDGDGIGRIDPDRLVVVHDGVVEVALGAIRVPTGGEGCGEFRIEPDRLVIICEGAVVIRDRAVMLALDVVRRAAVVNGCIRRR